MIEAIPAARTPFGLNAKLILTVFIVNDVVSTILQVTGAAMIGAAESNGRSPETANNVGFFLLLLLFLPLV